MSDRDASFELSKLIRQVSQQGPDMRFPRPMISGEYVPPRRGLAGARLVGYFELGKHDEEFEGRKRERDTVDLVFELSGPNHPPRVTEDGTKIPHRITVQEALSLDHDAKFFKLFAAMNAAHGGTATHMVQMLGKAFTVEVFHRPSRDGTRLYATLRGPRGYNLKAARAPVAPAVTELRAFVWNFASKAMWDGIYIPGEYQERRNDKGEVISAKRARNVLQERIMKAKNFAEIKDLVERY